MSISEGFFGPTNMIGRHSCKICGGYVDTSAKDGIKSLMKHLRDAECKGFRESVRALRMADSEGTELCLLNTATTAYKERCTQLEKYLRLAVRELDQLGSPLAKDPTMRQLVQPQASMRLASVSTSTTISQACLAATCIRIGHLSSICQSCLSQSITRPLWFPPLSSTTLSSSCSQLSSLSASKR
jgi:hypothetical protein